MLQDRCKSGAVAAESERFASIRKRAAIFLIASLGLCGCANHPPVPDHLAEQGVIKYCEPVWPTGANRARLEGFVELRFSVSEQGRPFNVRAIDANPRRTYEFAAREALECWRFQATGESWEGQFKFEFVY